ncbi:hypothetical protein DVH24_019717 [Malus domestica]|uniref:non-specific serine/threonine protein kinase n=1 Tax=Malus domestica TaxID=3750 RepID=A0A498I1M8_MALDO|nr:hypothetical protein DVH24_019717 [Malus domestica]
MWRFKPFMHKEPTGLEGRSIDVGNVKIHVKNAIAEGGFSCVYLARDAVHVSKQYALKHIIINDEELLELVMKEISVMKLLRGHPNVVTLCAHTILDMGRTKEALLVMDFCEKSLVNVLESRGAGFFEEKQVLAIFRDVCNAVFAMHSQSPPIAHRDLKAENLLLGPDGLWKLCDFGSISTNHKRFEKPEEMGIEEDNIRKHTTPAYRAPEVWFRVNELLPVGLQKSLPDRQPEANSAEKPEGLSRPHRSPPPPPASVGESARNSSQLSNTSRAGGGGGPIGAFWSTQHADSSLVDEKSIPKFDDEPTGHFTEKLDGVRLEIHPKPKNSAPAKEERAQTHATRRNLHGKSHKPEEGPSKDFEISFLQKDHGTERAKTSKSESSISFQDEAFNSFVADFDSKKLSSEAGNNKSGTEALEAEVERLKEQLKQANLEKAEITSKFEKLSAICRSQRQELQELKQTLAARTPSPNKDASRNQTSPGKQPSPPHRENIWKLQQGKSTPSPESKPWQPFAEEPKPPQPSSTANAFKSARTRNGHQNKQGTQVNAGFDSWGFGADSFSAASTGSTQISRPMSEGNNSQRLGEAKGMENSKPASQPAGWAGF